MDLMKVRQDLHKIPELAFKEFKTTEYIVNKLKEYPIETIRLEPTGVIAVYQGGEGEYSLFRCDIDALPLTEQTDCDFRSDHPGFMHACGHDMHMTIMLGFIDEVCATKPDNNILFLFQPAEEGKGGAEHIIESGVLNNWKIKNAFALHCSPDYPVGTVATKSGVFFGIPEEFVLEFEGRNSHAAFPNKGIDALYAGVQFYNLMQSHITKLFAATDPVIFHIGVMQAGEAENILAGKCLMKGTHRTLSTENHKLMNRMIEETGKSVETLTGAKFRFIEVSTYEAVNNDDELFETFRDTLSEDVTFVESESVMTGEDFGFFTSLYPSLLFWLGTGVSSNGLHSPKFLPAQEAISIGIKIYMGLLERL
jgi:N-acetyldiaminopimelate deacetylase